MRSLGVLMMLIASQSCFVAPTAYHVSRQANAPAAYSVEVVDMLNMKRRVVAIVHRDNDTTVEWSQFEPVCLFGLSTSNTRKLTEADWLEFHQRVEHSGFWDGDQFIHSDVYDGAAFTLQGYEVGRGFREIAAQNPERTPLFDLALALLALAEH